MRKCFEKEFSSIYVFNLRGNQRTSGELSRKEGGKIFGSGSRTPIAITILVKKPNTQNTNKAVIHYRDIGDYLSREDKLRIIRSLSSISNPAMDWKIIEPNEQGDWIDDRNEFFSQCIPLTPEKKFNQQTHTFFTTYAIGVATNRDAWVNNFSKERVTTNMTSMIGVYNREVFGYFSNNPNNLSVDDYVDNNPTKIAWTAILKNRLKKKMTFSFDETSLREAMYRPFTRTNLYFNRYFNEAIGLSPLLFPSIEHKNKVICISGIGQQKPFSVLISDTIADLQIVDKAQCFPLYWYDESTADIADLFNQGAEEEVMDRYIRRDGISDWILRECKQRYGNKVTKEDIFYYVYGILHSPEYRTTFEADLKKMLPRLPL